MTQNSKITIQSLYLLEIHIFTSFKLIWIINIFCLYLIVKIDF